MSATSAQIPLTTLSYRAPRAAPRIPPDPLAPHILTLRRVMSGPIHTILAGASQLSRSQVAPGRMLTTPTLSTVANAFVADVGDYCAGKDSSLFGRTQQVWRCHVL